MITLTFLTLIFLFMSLIFRTLYAFTKVFLWILGGLFTIIFISGIISATIVVVLPILIIMAIGLIIGIAVSSERK